MIKIDQGLTNEFIAGAFGLPIAHENLAYNATDGNPYAELLVLQNDVTALSMNDTDQTDGVFRVIIRYPTGGGAIGIKQKADEIMQHFKIGKSCRYGGATTKIVAQQRQPGVAENGWYKIILTFVYRTFLTRP